MNNLKKNSNIYYNYLSDIRFNISYSREILKKQFNHTPTEMGLSDKAVNDIFCDSTLGWLKLDKNNFL